MGFSVYRHGVARCETRLALSAVPWLPFHVDFESGYTEGNQPHSSFPELNELSTPAAAPTSVESLAIGGLQQSGASLAYSEYGLTGAGQTVAIIDSGIAYDHYALGRGYGEGYRVVGGWDFAENDSNPYDDGPGGFHGTHVAGIIGANDGVNLGVATGVDFVALRVFDDYGKGEMEWTEAALRWVHENRTTFANPITTVNLSLGASWNSATPPSWASLEDELATLQRDGIVVIVSAGNSFQQHQTSGLAYPASSPYAIPVASLDADGSLSSFSQRDERVIAAPGRNIESAVPDYFFGRDGIPNDWAKSSGTSMAAPFVAGASVLVREAMEIAGVSDITPQMIYSTLRDTATDIFDSVTNQIYKSLNIEAAIRSVLPNGVPVEANHGHAEGTPPPDSSVSQGSLPEFAKLVGETLTIRGNESQNQIALDLRDGIRVTVDGVSHRWSDASVANLVIDGMQNLDSIRIVGSELAEKIEMTPGRVDMSNARLNVSIVNVESIQFDGGGGPDRAYLYDGDTDDRLESYPNKAILTGVGYSFAVERVDRIFVHALQGGNDQAFVYDSAGNDVLSVRPQFTSISGAGYFNYLSGFERVYAYANQGGNDSAQLYDSAGNDQFSTSGEVTSIVGAGFSTFARGFSNVEAFSMAGGTDRALIYAPTGGSLTSGPDFVGMQGGGKGSIARNFGIAETFVGGKGVPLPGWGRLNVADLSPPEVSIASPEIFTLEVHGMGSGEPAVQAIELAFYGPLPPSLPEKAEMADYLRLSPDSESWEELAESTEWRGLDRERLALNSVFSRY